MPDGEVRPPPVRFTLTTPPPSTNNLYANTPHGRRKTPEYRRWLTASGWEMAAQRVRVLTGERFALYIEAPVNRRRDISNCIKAVEDLMVEQRLIPDDRWVDDLRIVRVPVGQPMAVEVWAVP